MTLRSIHRVVAILFPLLAFPAGEVRAVCHEFGGFSIFQCGYLGHFEPVPSPYGLEDVEAVFWQIGFGNDLVNTGRSTDGTGIGGPGIIIGNDSGFLPVDLRDAPLVDPSFPPGTICLGTHNWSEEVDGCCDNPRIDAFYDGGFLYVGDDDHINPYFNPDRVFGGDAGIYTRAAIMDYPVALLLKTPDSRYFAIAAVTNMDRGNVGILGLRGETERRSGRTKGRFVSDRTGQGRRKSAAGSALSRSTRASRRGR